jgi:hypothetical protein
VIALPFLLPLSFRFARTRWCARLPTTHPSIGMSRLHNRYRPWARLPPNPERSRPTFSAAPCCASPRWARGRERGRVREGGSTRRIGTQGLLRKLNETHAGRSRKEPEYRRRRIPPGSPRRRRHPVGARGSGDVHPISECYRVQPVASRAVHRDLRARRRRLRDRDRLGVGLLRTRAWAWETTLGVAVASVALVAIVAALWPGRRAFLAWVSLRPAGSWSFCSRSDGDRSTPERPRPPFVRR